MRPLLIFAAVAALPAVAQMPTEIPGKRDASRITGGTYDADAAHTLVAWRVDHMGFNPYYGLFGDAAGMLTLDPKDPASAKVDVTVPVARIVTVNADLTKHLLSKDFFGTAPAAARFVSSRVVPHAGERATIDGTLTLNGIAKPLRLEARFTGAGKAVPQAGGRETVGFEATGTISRSAFGLGYGVPIVGDAVRLEVTAAFEKQSRL